MPCSTSRRNGSLLRCSVQRPQDLGACAGCLFTDAHPVLARSLGEPRDCGWLPARLVRRRERRLVQPVSCAPAHRSRGLARASTPCCSTCSRTWGHAVRRSLPVAMAVTPDRCGSTAASATGLGPRRAPHPFSSLMTDAVRPNEPVSVEHVPHKPSTNARPVHPRRTWGLFPGWCGDAAPSGGATAPCFRMRSRGVLLRHAVQQPPASR